MRKFKFSSAGPALPALSIVTSDGEKSSSRQWAGTLTLVNFWATWCEACKEELPALSRLQNMFSADEMRVVAINIDRADLVPARRYLDKIGVRNLALVGTVWEEAEQAWNLRGVPTTLLIDAKGREIGRYGGKAAWDSDEAILLIKAMARRGAKP